MQHIKDDVNRAINNRRVETIFKSKQHLEIALEVLFREKYSLYKSFYATIFRGNIFFINNKEYILSFISMFLLYEPRTEEPDPDIILHNIIPHILIDEEILGELLGILRGTYKLYELLSETIKDENLSFQVIEHICASEDWITELNLPHIRRFLNKFPDTDKKARIYELTQSDEFLPQEAKDLFLF